MRATSTASHDCRMTCARAARCGGAARGARVPTRHHAHAQAQHQPRQGQQQLQHAQQPTFPAAQKGMQALHGAFTAASAIALVRATLLVHVAPPCQFSQRVDDAFMYTITNITLHNAISHMFFAGIAQPGGDDGRSRRSHERAEMPTWIEPHAPPCPQTPNRPRLTSADLSGLLRAGDHVTTAGRPKGPPLRACAKGSQMLSTSARLVATKAPGTARARP